jgi:hypothetical protein
MITKLITRSNNKNKTNMKAEIKKIYPHQAKQLLKLNTRNRPLASRHVNLLADEMRSGNWKLNGETITLSDDALLDGQHRLAACVLANTPFESFVIEGADSDCFDTIDVGKKRTNADTLHVKGEKNYVALSSSLRVIHYYYSEIGEGKKDVCTQLTNIQVQQLLEWHPNIRKSVNRFVTPSSKSLVPLSHVCAFHYIFSLKDPELADEFMDKLVTGNNLSGDDPVSVLRNKLIVTRLNNTKITSKVLRAYLIKTWNAVREGKTMRNIFWRSTRYPNEKFPTAK